MSIQDLIARVSATLTPTERRIAEAVLEEPTLLAFGTVSDLAERMGTSRPSIVRFATKLGFSGYPELQRWARDGVERQLATPGQRIRQAPGLDRSTRREIEWSLRESLELLSHDRLKTIAPIVAAARNVWVISGETSRAGAIVFRSGLSMVRDRVRLVEEHDLGRDLSQASAGDAAVVFDFARYRKGALIAAEAFARRGADVVAVTDGPLSPFVPISRAWCELKVHAVGLFDSSLPSVLAAELIVLEVVRQLGPTARERIDLLEQMWVETNTFHPGA